MAVVVVDADAREELIESKEFLEAARPGYGLLFTEALEREFELLARYPRIGKRIRGKIRRRTIVGWSYSIFYEDAGDIVRILAIAHGSRRPGYWRKRLR